MEDAGNVTTQIEFGKKPYALYKSLSLLGYFDSPGEAFAAGIARYPDGIFSIQEVTRGVSQQDR